MRRAIVFMIMLMAVPIVQAQELPMISPVITVENADQLAPQRVLLRGPARAISWSPTADLIAVASQSGVWLYDTNRLETQAQLVPDAGRPVGDVVFSSDGRWLASANYGYGVFLWNPVTGEQSAHFETTADSMVVAISPDNTRLASGDRQGEITIWDIATGSLINTFSADDDGDWLAALNFNADGTQLVASAAPSMNTTATIWDVASGTLLGELSHPSGVTGAVFGPNGTVITVSTDGYLRIFDGATRQMIGEFSAEGITFFNSVAVSADGQWVITSAGDTGAGSHVWEAATGALRQTLAGPGAIVSAAFNADASRIAGISGDGVIVIWDAATGAALQTADWHRGAVITGDTVAFAPDGSYLAVGTESHDLLLLDPVTGARLSTIPAHTGVIMALAVSADSRRIATGSGPWDIPGLDQATIQQMLASGEAETTSTVRVWDAQTGQQVALLAGHEAVKSVAFSPTDNVLAAGSYAGVLRIWDLNTAELLHEISVHTAQITDIAFNPTGTLLATVSGDRTVRLWDTATFANVETFAIDSSWPDFVTFTPDGSTLMIGDAGLIRQIDVASHELLSPLQTEDNAGAIGFTPDGSIMATYEYANSPYSNAINLSLRAVATGQPIATFDGETCYDANDVDFSPDGRALITTTGLGVIYRWGVPPLP